jgi:hypothetical protein
MKMGIQSSGLCELGLLLNICHKATTSDHHLKDFGGTRSKIGMVQNYFELLAFVLKLWLGVLEVEVAQGHR